MNNKSKQEKKNTAKGNSMHVEELVEGEETTQYGEFISSYFAWVGLNKQRTRAEELNDMARKRK